MPSLPANFMLLCVAMVMQSQRTPAGSLCLCVCVRYRERRTNGQRASRRGPGSNSDLPSSSALLSSSLFSALSPLADPHPKHSAAGLSCQCSPIPTAPFPALCICLDGGGFALGPRAGEPVPVSSPLKPNRLLFEVAYHTDAQIGDYKAAACLQSV